MSKPATCAARRALAALGTAAPARRSRASSAATSRRPLTACSSPLKIAQAGRERVHDEVVAARRGDRDAGGGVVERAERAARACAPARLAQRRGAARERLDRGRLRHPADPRRRAAAVGEVVLPGEEAAARGRRGDAAGRAAAAQLVHRAGGAAARCAARCVRHGAGQRVDPAPARERLELQPVAGVVLEHRRVAAERRALGAARGTARRVQNSRVAAQDQERRPQPAGREQVLRGEVVDRRQDRVQLGGARAGQMVERAPRVVVVAREARVGDGRDVPGEEGVAQGTGDRSRVVGAADRGAQECEAARLGRGGRHASWRPSARPGSRSRGPRAAERASAGAARAPLRIRPGRRAARRVRAGVGPCHSIDQPLRALDRIVRNPTQTAGQRLFLLSGDLATP